MKQYRHIVVTGAASGIGQAVAEALAPRTARLTLWDRNAAGLAATAEACAATRAEPLAADITAEAAVRAAFDRWEGEGDFPDLIFHAAGILQCGDLEDVTAESCRQVMDVNYHGTVHLVLHGARRMAPGGRVVCMASIAGLKGLPEFAAYCASKFAVVGFCEAVVHDLRRRGVALSIVSPPAIDTPMVQNLPQRPVLYDIFPFAPKEQVVAQVVESLEARDRFLILVDAQSRLLHKVNAAFPAITGRVIDRIAQWKRKRDA